MSLQHCPCRIPGSCCIPSPCSRENKQPCGLLEPTCRCLKCRALHHSNASASLQEANALSPCDPSLGQSVMEHEGNGAWKKGEGKKQFSTQFSYFLKEESDL